MKKAPVQTGVIAAAGKGTRAYPRSVFIPKPLFVFENRTILESNVAIQVEKYGVTRLFILVGHLKDLVLEEIVRIQKKYPRCEIIPALWTGRGLAADVASLRDRIQEDFTLILGDELYFETNHESLVQKWSKKAGAKALVGILETDLVSDIRKNYSVELEKDRVQYLIEKPQHPPNRLLGLGSYIFSPEFFDFFDSTPPSERTGVVELTDVIDRMAKETGRVYAGKLKGSYFNINSLADLYTATYRVRSQKFHSFKLSLVLPAYNNEQTLPDVISDFKRMVHEVIVADMGSSDRTVDIALGQKVNLVQPEIENPKSKTRHHNARGIYDTIRKAKGDIVVLAPADGSFRSRDLPKLLEYLKDSDMVVGTRTTRQLIEQGSNMKPMNRWLNVVFGKIVEVLWWGQEPRFTDIGCVYRAFWKDSFQRIEGDLRAKDKTYLVEMMIEMVRYHMRCIEIPVSYFRQYGNVEKQSREEKWRYFFSVLRMILFRRFQK